MLEILMGWGLSSKLAKIVLYVALPAALLIAIILALHFYGASRYNAGVAATDAKWKAAGDKVLKDAAVSGHAADKSELPRVLDYQSKVEHEKEKLDEAEANGSSPFDVLFPGAGNGMSNGS